MFKKGAIMDRRIKYTKRVIKENFLNLLEEKDIMNITVKELCELSDINRGTFYRYYIDIYELLKTIEQEFIDEVKNSSSIVKIEEHSVYSFTKGILSILENNKKLVKILFDRNLLFFNEVLEIVYDKCFNRWKNIHPEIDEDEIENAVVFIFNGALGIINYWVKNDFFPSSNSIALYIEKFCQRGARMYLPKEKQFVD